MILGPPLCLQALAKLQWPGAARFAAAKKQVWHQDSPAGPVAGYVLEAVEGPRRVGLTHATVRLAGHLVPQVRRVCVIVSLFPLLTLLVQDAPTFAFDLAKRFISGAGFQ